MSQPCPIKRATDLFGGKWKPGLLYRLENGAKRYSELRREMPWLSERVLTRALRELEADGLITRRAHGPPPARVDYALSAEGRTLGPVLAAICQWGEARIAREQA